MTGASGNPLLVNNWQVSSSDGSDSKKLILNGPPESAADLESAQAWQGQRQRTKARIGIMPLTSLGGQKDLEFMVALS